MKRGWRVFLLLLGIVAIVVIAFQVSAPPEPVYQERTLTSWLADLRSVNPDIRTNAALAIRHMGTNAVPNLVRMLHAKDSRLTVAWINLASRQRLFKVRYRFDFEKREDGLRGLGALGPDAKAAIPEIVKLLDTGPDKQMAAYTLSRIGSDAVPALGAALGSTNDQTRRHAATFLGLEKERGDQTVPALIKALRDPDFLVKSHAARSLSRFPSQAEIIVPALISALDDPDETFRCNVAHALVRFGDSAKPAIPKLLKMIETGGSSEGQTAAGALLRLDSAATIGLLITNLASPDVLIKRRTAWSLMVWKNDGAPAVPALVECLKDSDGEVKQNAAVALREIAAQPDLVVPALMKNLNDPDLKVRSITAIALSSFGEKAKPAVPVILKLLEENRTNQLTAGGLFDALAKIDPETADKLEAK